MNFTPNIYLVMAVGLLTVILAGAQALGEKKPAIEKICNKKNVKENCDERNEIRCRKRCCVEFSF